MKAMREPTRPPALFVSERIPGQQAINHIVDATNCAVEDAWIAFRDAASDGKLIVWMLGADWGPNGRVDRVGHVERFEPKPVPVGYWKRAAMSGDLYLMTDLHRFEVSRADVGRLWPATSEATAAPKLASRRRGRGEAPYWKRAHRVIDEWLEEHGLPQPGDGEQATLEKYVEDWLNKNTEEPAVESTIRIHVKKRIDEYKAKVGGR